MKKILLVATLTCLAGSRIANAFSFDFTVIGDPITAPTADTITFDEAGLSGLTVPNGGTASITKASYGVTISTEGYNSGIVNSSPYNLSGEYAQPYAGDPSMQANAYLTAGGMATLQYDRAMSSLSLLWGSVDLYNTLTFYYQGQLVGPTLANSSIVGGQIFANANGNQMSGGSAYLNITGLTFDKVVLVSTQKAFEVDNITATAATSVPDGGATLALLGLAMSGMALVRRKLS